MKCKEWRKRHRAREMNSVAMEEAAIELGIGDLVEPEVDYSIRLVNVMMYADLGTFERRAKEMTEILGVAPELEFSTNDQDETPDLKAFWMTGRTFRKANEDGSFVDGQEVVVALLGFYMAGCKLDPRTPAKPRAETRVHPECAAAVENIEVNLSKLSRE